MSAKISDYAIYHQALRSGASTLIEGDGFRLYLGAGNVLMTPHEGGVMVSKAEIIKGKGEHLTKGLANLADLSGTTLFADKEDRVSQSLIQGSVRTPQTLPVFIIMAPGVLRDPDIVEGLGERNSSLMYDKGMVNVHELTQIGHVVLYYDADAQFFSGAHLTWLHETMLDARRCGRGAVEVTSEPRLAADKILGEDVIDAVNRGMKKLEQSYSLGEVKIIGLTMDSQVLRAELGFSTTEGPGW